MPKNRLENRARLSDEERIALSRDYYEFMAQRRTIRRFSSRPVPREVIENCLRTAGTAPSGANLQPWSFVVIESPEMKQQIRQKAESEEQLFYAEKISDEWAHDLKPLGTGPVKPFLEEAPFLISVFQQAYGFQPDGTKKKHYYTKESVGLATGLLVSALHHAGLAVLTYTPPNMQFLAHLLNRSENERAMMLMVTGYPNQNAVAPDLQRKSLEEIAAFI